MKLNPHISVDCVIFGFDGEKLKVLLLERKINTTDLSEPVRDFKLPGDFITDEEDLNTAANRILKELTGLDHIYLKQFMVFGKPGRISRKIDLEWLRDTTGLPIERVVTVAYYSLIKITESRMYRLNGHNAQWVNMEEIRELAFDHIEILDSGINTLRTKLQFEPIGLELLPRKFTLRQLQNLYEIILGRNLDNRNFRKKVLKADYLIPLEEKEKDVAHKPARLFTFNKKLYEDSFNHFVGFQF